MTPENSSNDTPQFPIARRIQIRTGPEDAQLANRARIRRPGVKWWWGRRSSETGAIALCYLCDETIATWSGRWPITVTAQIQIDVHRFRHLTEGSGPLGIQEASER